MIRVALVCCWLAVLLRTAPAWWRWLNRAGAGIGRAVAWSCSGGLGRKLAQAQLEPLRRAERLAALQVTWLMRDGSSGLWQQAASGAPLWTRWLCPACHHGNHGCTLGRCRCTGRRFSEGGYDV